MLYKADLDPNEKKDCPLEIQFNKGNWIIEKFFFPDSFFLKIIFILETMVQRKNTPLMTYWQRGEREKRTSHYFLNILEYQTQEELFLWKRQNWSWAASVYVWRFYWNYGPVLGEKFTEKLDCRFWEGNSEVVIFSKVMVMKFNESLDCFFHRSQLNECHFAIFPENGRRNRKSI